MADGHIQVPADSIGKKVDAEEYTRADGNVVEKQRVQMDMSETNDLLSQLILEIRDLKFKLLSALG